MVLETKLQYQTLEKTLSPLFIQNIKRIIFIGVYICIAREKIHC